MAHRTARLNVFGRQLLVTRVELDGWPIGEGRRGPGREPNDRPQVGRPLPGRGLAGSRGPQLAAASLAAPDAARARSRRSSRARVERRWGPHRLGPLLGQPRSTVYAVLARAGYSRLRDADRLSGVPVRYVHDHPGSLVHQDHKKLGRIPDGGGHRLLGRAAAPHRHGEAPASATTTSRSSSTTPPGWPTSPRCPTRAPQRQPGAARRRGLVRRARRPDRAGPDRQRLGVHQPDLRARRSTRSAPATSGPGRTGPRPTARPSGSSRRCSPSGRTAGSIAPTTSASSALPGWVALLQHERTHTALGGITPWPRL